MTYFLTLIGTMLLRLTSALSSGGLISRQFSTVSSTLIQKRPKHIFPLPKNVRMQIKRYRTYCRSVNKVRKLTRTSRKEYERKIARKAKTIPKAIRQYVNDTSRIKYEIPDLDPNTTLSSDQAKS